MKKRGYTFIELMIVIGIISLMLAAALAMINSNQRAQQDVEMEGRKVASVVASLRNDALSGKGAGGGCTYQFIANNNAAVYNTAGCVVANYATIGGVRFSGNVNFSFSSPFGAKSPLATNMITLTKSGKYYYVCVYANGKIFESLTSTCPAP